MGDNYSTNLRIKFKKRGDNKKAEKALRDLIAKANETNTNYQLDEYAKQGIKPDTFDNLMRIFFAGGKGQEVTIGEWRDVDGVKFFVRKGKDGFVPYHNDFSCSYGWQAVMWRMFDTIAPYCADGTELGISYDEGYLCKVVEDGNAEEDEHLTREEIDAEIDGEDD